MMLTPKDLGLPEKFKSWWPGQLEMIEMIAKSPEKVFLLDVPWGNGKSLISISSFQRLNLWKEALAVLDRLTGDDQEKMLNELEIASLIKKPRVRCIYVTPTKQLQDQILAEFPGARTIKGRNNFPCLLYPKRFPDITAEDCIDSPDKPCKYFRLSIDSPDKPCKYFRLMGDPSDCPYMVAKFRATRGSLAVLNTSYFLAEANGPGMFSGTNLLIIDELDELEDALMNFIQLVISEKQLNNFKIRPPKDTASLKSWQVWAEALDLNLRINQIQYSLANLDPLEWSDIDIKQHKQVAKLKAFQNRLKLFVQEVNDSWVFYEEKSNDETSWIFKPVLVSNYAEKFIFRHASRILGMSASIFNPKAVSDNLGLTTFDYHRATCLFPKDNRPIYYQPVANLRHDTMQTEMAKLIPAISDILDRYQEKVLIHTTSYLLKDFLMKFLPQGSRLITHDKNNRAEQLEIFKQSAAPLVMISPSFDRGVDLPDNLCRCIIVCKVPYLSLGDLQIKKRLELPGGQLWYLLKAAQTLVQMTGRGVRSRDDWCDAYILDHQFEVLMTRVGHLIPDWWKGAIKEE